MLAAGRTSGDKSAGGIHAGRHADHPPGAGSYQNKLESQTLWPFVGTAVEVRPLAAGMAESKEYQSEEYAVRDHWVRRILRIFQIDAHIPIRDAFASPGNQRFTNYWTVHDKALQQQWWGELLWLNPPWTLWPLVAAKVEESGASCVAVFPAWSKDWVNKMLIMATKLIYFEVGSKIFQLHGVAVPGIKWGLYAVYIVGSQPVLAPVHPKLQFSPASRRRWRRKQRWVQ